MKKHYNIDQLSARTQGVLGNHNYANDRQIRIAVELGELKPKCMREYGPKTHQEVLRWLASLDQ